MCSIQSYILYCMQYAAANKASLAHRQPYTYTMLLSLAFTGMQLQLMVGHLAERELFKV